MGVDLILLAEYHRNCGVDTGSFRIVKPQLNHNSTLHRLGQFLIFQCNQSFFKSFFFNFQFDFQLNHNLTQHTRSWVIHNNYTTINPLFIHNLLDPNFLAQLVGVPVGLYKYFIFIICNTYQNLFLFLSSHLLSTGCMKPCLGHHRQGDYCPWLLQHLQHPKPFGSPGHMLSLQMKVDWGFWNRLNKGTDLKQKNFKQRIFSTFLYLL